MNNGIFANYTGIPIIVVPDSKKQNRTHKKKRINKKWAKRYGYQYKYIDIGKYNIKSNGKDEIVMAKKT